MKISDVKKDLRDLANKERIKDYQRFFKTGKGEYGEGDIFLGVTVPNTRKVAKKYSEIPLEIVGKLVRSKYHEERLLALLILVEKFQKIAKLEKSHSIRVEPLQVTKKQIFDLYLRNIRYVNNWDLVDLSAHKIVGAYLQDKDRKLLYKLARSNDLWEKRISIISTFWFIKDNDFKDTLKISEILLCDKHDLIHKAVGWTLREVGKKDMKVEEKFLKKYYMKMPRTMLRYAIEKFPENLRKKYLKGKI
ncbi:DNA alkylation repair protein [Candidatus Woesebacteria bacterium]|nr:DNA alkylation repair protein [Candidatus Woesebacteria bacterium]